MKVKHVILVLVMLLFVGCSTINTKLTDPIGRQMPSPHYVMQVVGQPLYVSFYYTAFETVTDLDGSVIAKPVFLDFLTFHDLYAQRTKAITLTLEVSNPKHIEYSLYEQLKMEVGNSRKEVRRGGTLNRSNLEYRQFSFQLPYGKDVRSVDHLVMFQVEGQDVLQIGNLRYNLIH